MPILPTTGLPLSATTPSARPAKTPEALEQTARDFEAAFLTEAFSHMGLDRTKGVEGAAPFASFVNRAYAEQLVERGGIGLAENIVRALAAKDDNA